MRKKIKKIIIILCIFLTINNYVVFGAVSRDKYQKAIAGWSYDFYLSNGNKTVYSCTNQSSDWQNQRAHTYMDDLDYNGGFYKFDCVGFVAYAIHHATGLGTDTYVDFTAPKCCPIPVNTTYGFEQHDWNGKISELQPGDILQSQGNGSGHVMIYVGDIDKSGKGTIIHCAGYGGPNGPKETVDQGWGVICEYLENSTYYNQLNGFGRISDKGLEMIDEGELSDKSINVSSILGKNAVNMSNFYYNGIPDGKYSVTKGFFEMLIEALLDIFEFLVTLMANIMRMVFVGWTAVAENLVTSTVKSVSGEKDIEIISSTDMGIDSGKNITVEKIVFNQISIFDVNFFNYNEENP